MKNEDKLYLEKVKRKVFYKIPTDITKLVDIELALNQWTRELTLTLLTELFAETVVDKKSIKIPANWWSHLLLDLNICTQLIKYKTIIVATEISKIDPTFTSMFGKLLNEERECNIQ